MKHAIWKVVFLSLLPILSPLAFAYEPAAKTECIAPADPGGGWDFTCRNAANVFKDLGLVPKTMQTINMAGAGGGVAYAHTVSKRSGDEDLLVAASTSTATRLAQNQFPGMDASMVNWLGTIGADYGVIAVAKDSPYQNLDDLMKAMKEDPRAVKFAGGSANGGWDHLKVLIAAKAAGVKNLPRIPYLSYNNGGEAITQLIGGHVDAFTGDVTETQGFLKSGDMRVLAVLSDERLPGDLSDIPTAKEQGIDAIGANWRGFYMPADVSEDARDYWTNAINTLYESDEWKNVMRRSGLMPFRYSGEAFNEFVNQQIQDIQSLSKEIGLIQ
ncbi:Bug family tripartite tricarboxylate transporter substrate binding protein [Salinicola halophyticus]|uniref:Bug family tripartite tricarboxylate transporter substrate binding protein n=1 Tax=Salinicola halophyticus TaxID=1808881 RepID=UPI003F4507E9